MEDIVSTGKRYTGYGLTVRAYCERVGISLSRWYRMVGGIYRELSPKTQKRTIKNPYALTEKEKDEIVEYAVSHPRYYHREMAYRMIDENIVYTSPSSVYRILKKNGLIKENVYKKRYGWAHRYSNQAQGPDELWQADITYLRYGGRDVYQLSFIDVYSRFVVLSVTLTNMESKTVSKVFEEFIQVHGATLKQKPRLQTDNGSSFVGGDFREIVKKYVAEHTTIHPSMPTENVIIERWHRTFKEILYEMEDPASFEELVKVTKDACAYYNYEWYHQSLGYMTPYEWYRGNSEAVYYERAKKPAEARRARKECNCIREKCSLSLGTLKFSFCVKHYNQM